MTVVFTFLGTLFVPSNWSNLRIQFFVLLTLRSSPWRAIEYHVKFFGTETKSSLTKNKQTTFSQWEYLKILKTMPTHDVPVFFFVLLNSNHRFSPTTYNNMMLLPSVWEGVHFLVHNLVVSCTKKVTGITLQTMTHCAGILITPTLETSCCIHWICFRN